MSRNLCPTDPSKCCYCGDELEQVEAAHSIRPDEAHVFFSEYEGMIVAKAVCPSCGAEYLAWLDESNRVHNSLDSDGDGIQDLSFYSSFNDEPGDADLPKWKVVRVVTYVRLYPINRKDVVVIPGFNDHKIDVVARGQVE